MASILNPVVLKNVSMTYGATEVLNRINIEFPENKITAVIGRSGSGKSTLLKIINALVIPNQGDVFVFGKKINYRNSEHLPYDSQSVINKLRLRIGFSVQGTTLFPHLNVYKNISLLARLNKWSEQEIEERTAGLMKLVDLPEEYRKKYPYQLSGGEQQRVGICRAMMLNPPVFLLDEAFGALDPTTKSEIHTELLKIQKSEPRTIIMVTHDLHEAFKVGDKIVIIEKGKIQQEGNKEEIMNKPANDFVRYFINSQTN